MLLSGKKNRVILNGEFTMEDKIYKVTVEKMNRVQILITLLVIYFGAFGGSSFLESNCDISISGEVILLVILVVMCILLTKFERYFPKAEELEATFKKDVVVFKRRRAERIITYSDITEVEKIMIINRYHSEKGYYRVKVKTKGRTYAMYSGEDSNKELDFSETELSGIYYEFKNRGVKCC